MSKTSQKQKLEALYAWLNFIKKYAWVLIIPLLFACKAPVAVEGQLYKPAITYGAGKMCIALDGYVDYNPDQIAALLRAGATINLLGIDIYFKKDTIDSSHKFIGHAEKCIDVK